MVAPVEWLYDFTLLSNSEEIPYTVAEQYLKRITEWAEARDLGIGGGFSEEDSNTKQWHFRFGLTATKGAQVIPKDIARQLFEDITDWAQFSKQEVIGEFREFTSREQSSAF